MFCGQEYGKNPMKGAFLSHLENPTKKSMGRRYIYHA